MPTDVSLVHSVSRRSRRPRFRRTFPVFALSAALIGALATSGAALAATPLGSQFQVNTYTTSSQFRPAVAMSGSGLFVVVWDSGGSFGGDTDSGFIAGRRYNASGSPFGAQFLVNTYTTGNQMFPSVGMESNGDFVVVWSSFGSPGSDTDNRSVQGQRFAASGTKVGAQFQVNTYITSIQNIPSVSMDSDGDFVVAWHSQGSLGSDTSDYSIQGRRYDTSGSAKDVAEFQINTYTTGRQHRPSIALDFDGDFVVVWPSNGSSGTDTSDFSIQGQQYDGASGAVVGAQFQVNTYTTDDQRYPSVASKPGGDFVVVWDSEGSAGNDNSGTSIQGQRYDAFNNVAIGFEFQVNNSTGGFQLFPSVGVEGAGDFVVAWETSVNTEIFGRHYDASGDPVDSNFRVDNLPELTGSPAVAFGGTKEFVVAWEGTDGSGPSIEARRFTVSDVDSDGVEAH